jgi:3-oxoacyl-[acyl-carrier protein] reductase
MQLEAKLVVITGAGRGIGRAMALAFARKRSDVALLDLNQTDLDRTRELCEAESVRCQTYLCNVTREKTCRARSTAWCATSAGST